MRFHIETYRFRARISATTSSTPSSPRACSKIQSLSSTKLLCRIDPELAAGKLYRPSDFNHVTCVLRTRGFDRVDYPVLRLEIWCTQSDRPASVSADHNLLLQLLQYFGCAEVVDRLSLVMQSPVEFRFPTIFPSHNTQFPPARSRLH